MRLTASSWNFSNRSFKRLCLCQLLASSDALLDLP